MTGSKGSSVNPFTGPPGMRKKEGGAASGFGSGFWVEMEGMVEDQNCNARKSLGLGKFIACHSIFFLTG